LPIPPESLIKGTVDITEHRLSDHVAKLIKVQSLLIEIARDNQLSADSFHMKEASPLSDMFPVNSYVLLKPPDGARAKLQMPKAGPYIVVGINRDKYFIQDLLTHKKQTRMFLTFVNSGTIPRLIWTPSKLRHATRGNSLSTGSLDTGAKHQSVQTWNF
jgi:hypothetical protein